MPAYDDAETATGYDPIRSLSSTPGHVIATVSGLAVFMSIAARDILRLEAGPRRLTLIGHGSSASTCGVKNEQLSNRSRTHHPPA